MSRAVETWRLSGRPEALTKRVFCMPSSSARRVIIAAKRASDPPSFSARATAMSLADLMASACIACSTVKVSPGRRPSLVGAWAAARGEITTGSSRRMRPAASASNARYSVITFVIEAGYRGLSARLAYMTSPVFASTTMAAYLGWLAGSWR